MQSGDWNSGVRGLFIKHFQKSRVGQNKEQIQDVVSAGLSFHL